jgi:hypothetical protein
MAASGRCWSRSSFFDKFADLDPKYFAVPAHLVRTMLDQARAAR